MSTHTFKVGDRVRVKKTNGIGTIIEDGVWSGEKSYRVLYDGMEKWACTYWAEALELFHPEVSSPIKTVKQIVPGWYGIVSVHRNPDGSIDVDVEQDGVTASQLRAAAKVFAELADALDEQGGE